MFSGFNRSVSVAESIFANASSVGANTVNGPLPFNVSTRPAASTAVTKVLNFPPFTAVSTKSGKWPPACPMLVRPVNNDATKNKTILNFFILFPFNYRSQEILLVLQVSIEKNAD